MKKLVSLLLCLLMVGTACIAAADYKAGDTVTISVSVSNPNKACAFDIGFSYDTSALTFVSATGSNGVAGGPNGFSFAAWDPFAGGSIGTVTFKVNAAAVPGKTYTISCYNLGAYDFDDNEVSIGVSVSGGSVTIESAACTSHSWNDGTVTTAATCAKEGVKTFTCTACGDTKTEAIPKLTTHSYDGGKVTQEATCTKDGVKTFTCSVCGSTKTEAIAAAGHTEGEWTTTQEATCKKDGLKELRCSVCGETLDSEVIPATGIYHTDGEWAVTTEPTCTKDGVKSLTCAVCGEVLDTEAIPATGHTDGEWAVTTEPSCTKDGVKSLTCAVCGEVLDTEAIPATGHDEGEWVVVKEATCKEDGTKELQCTVCGAVLDNETIPAADAEHVPGDMVTTTPATCTEDGEKTQSCTVCGEVLATETVPALGHDDGKWITVKPATKEETGLKELHCTRCDALLDTAEIPVKTTDYYTRNTVCSFGPSFHKESVLTDAWYRFTPIDLSADGMQTFDLIASDAYAIGQVTVTVADGMVTLDYAYVSDGVKEHSAFCTLLPSLAETATLDLEQLTSYAFGTPISIAEDLNGDTKVLLFVCNVVDYHSDLPITRLWPNSDDFMRKVDALKVNMD